MRLQFYIEWFPQQAATGELRLREITRITAGSAVSSPTPAWSRTTDPAPVEPVSEVTVGAAGAAFSGAVGAADARETGARCAGVSSVRELVGKDAALRLLVKVWGELPDSVRNRI